MSEFTVFCCRATKTQSFKELFVPISISAVGLTGQLKTWQ